MRASSYRLLCSQIQKSKVSCMERGGERKKEGGRGKDGEKWEGQREGERGRVRLKEIGRAGRTEGRRGRDGRREEKEGC